MCHNSLYSKIYTWKQSILLAITLWAICFVLEIPNYFSWGGHTFDPKTMACSYDRTANYTYTLFFVMVAIAPPLILVCFCYLRIFLAVRASKKALEAITNKDEKKSASKDSGWDSKELKLAKTLFIVFVTFLIFWAPYAVVVLIDYGDNWPKVVYVIVIQLAHTNSSANSIIYAATNKDFREGYRRFICCWTCRRQSRKQQPKWDAARYLAAHHFFNTKNVKDSSVASEDTNDTVVSDDSKNMKVSPRKPVASSALSQLRKEQNKNKIMSNKEPQKNVKQNKEVIDVFNQTKNVELDKEAAKIVENGNHNINKNTKAVDIGMNETFRDSKVIEKETHEINKDTNVVENEIQDFNKDTKVLENEIHGLNNDKKDVVVSETHEINKDTDVLENKTHKITEENETHEINEDTKIVENETHETNEDTKAVENETHENNEDTKAVKNETHETNEDTKAVEGEKHEINEDTKAVKNETHETSKDKKAVENDTHENNEDTKAVENEIHENNEDTKAVENETHEIIEDTKTVENETHEINKDTEGVQNETHVIN